MLLLLAFCVNISVMAFWRKTQKPSEVVIDQLGVEPPEIELVEQANTFEEFIKGLEPFFEELKIARKKRSHTVEGFVEGAFRVRFTEIFDHNTFTKKCADGENPENLLMGYPREERRWHRALKMSDQKSVAGAIIDGAQIQANMSVTGQNIGNLFSEFYAGLAESTADIHDVADLYREAAVWHESLVPEFTETAKLEASLETELESYVGDGLTNIEEIITWLEQGKTSVDLKKQVAEYLIHRQASPASKGLIMDKLEGLRRRDRNIAVGNLALGFVQSRDGSEGELALITSIVNSLNSGGEQKTEEEIAQLVAERPELWSATAKESFYRYSQDLIDQAKIRVGNLKKVLPSPSKDLSLSELKREFADCWSRLGHDVKFAEDKIFLEAFARNPKSTNGIPDVAKRYIEPEPIKTDKLAENAETEHQPRRIAVAKYNPEKGSYREAENSENSLEKMIAEVVKSGLPRKDVDIILKILAKNAADEAINQTLNGSPTVLFEGYGMVRTRVLRGNKLTIPGLSNVADKLRVVSFVPNGGSDGSEKALFIRLMTMRHDDEYKKLMKELS